jgi:hypothetical protein
MVKKKKVTKKPGRVLHGKYIGYLKHLPNRECRRRVRKVRALEGVRAAIREARRIKREGLNP